MNPGDLDWSCLEALGELTVYPRTPADQVVARAAAATAILTNKVPFTAAEFAALADLKYVGVTATGYNIIDVDAARAHDVTVTNVPAYSTPAVAQAVFALLLELTNHVGDLNRDVRQRWPQCPDFAYWDRGIVELAGLTLGIVGYGQIGAAVAAVGRAFGMNIIAHTRTPRDEPGVEFVDLDQLIQSADVISLHCPLTEQTHNLIDAARLSHMKSTAYLINTGRGPLLDEAAVAAALDAGQIAGAGLDVLSTEPPAPDNPLLSAKHCIITPHVAWAARAARQRLLDTTAANLKAFLDGTPQNVVT